MIEFICAVVETIGDLLIWILNRGRRRGDKAKFRRRPLR